MIIQKRVEKIHTILVSYNTLLLYNFYKDCQYFQIDTPSFKSFYHFRKTLYY